MSFLNNIKVTWFFGIFSAFQIVATFEVHMTEGFFICLMESTCTWYPNMEITVKLLLFYHLILAV